MTVTVRERGQAAIVDVEGQLTFENPPDLRGPLLQALQKKTQAAVLVNLGAVGYMDSSGIATLVEGLKAAQANKVPFGLCSLSKNLRNVLELVRLLAKTRQREEALPLLAGLRSRTRGKALRPICALQFRLSPTPKNAWRWFASLFSRDPKPPRPVRARARG